MRNRAHTSASTPVMRDEVNAKRRVARMKVAKRAPRAPTALCAALCLAAVCFAQVDRSGLSGTVTDASGRVLPHARITAVQGSTQLRRETESTSSGSYDIPALPVGVYTITFNRSGFKTLTFVDVEQVIGRTRTLDATLQVAGSEEQVKVSASSEQMDTSTDALGGRIQDR